MTTYEEYATSKRSNRNKWNEATKFRIALLKEDYRVPATITGHRDLLVRGLRACLANRKNFKYLEI